MTPQYSMVNQCLDLLKQADLPPIKKLRIEIQLIQMKRLLLDEDFLEVSCEGTLREVLSDLRKIHQGEHDADTAGSVIARLGHIVNVQKAN